MQRKTNIVISKYNVRSVSKTIEMRFENVTFDTFELSLMAGKLANFRNSVGATSIFLYFHSDELNLSMYQEKPKTNE